VYQPAHRHRLNADHDGHHRDDLHHVHQRPNTTRRVERTQECVLRWSPDSGQTLHEVIRQQWNFSPHGATTQTEDLHVELTGVTLLELSIVPDIGGGPHTRHWPGNVWPDPRLGYRTGIPVWPLSILRCSPRAS
jgi:hypothetical protein